MSKNLFSVDYFHAVLYKQLSYKKMIAIIRASHQVRPLLFFISNVVYLHKRTKKMDIQTRKIHFIQEILRIKNEKIIDKLEKMLHQEKKKTFDKEFSPMSLEDFNSIIDKAEEDSEAGRLYNAVEILKDIDTWK